MIFSKLERGYVRFFSEDEDRMRLMSSIEERKYKRELLMNKRCQVEEKVPNKGVSSVVYEREDVSELKIGLSHLILKVMEHNGDMSL